MQYSKTLTIGILAHVDAGKTTITEHMLYQAGAIRNLGSVDKGSTVTDSLALEKERGISIKTAATSFVWNDTKINLIDTPGHADFSSEVSRSLCVLDAVVLVISAVEGIQAHTLTITEALQDLQIPILIFINKIDRAGADCEQVYQQLKKELDFNLAPILIAENEGLDTATITATLHNETIKPTTKQDLFEVVITQEENLLERYLDGLEINDSDYMQAIQNQVQKQQIVPCYTGIAKNNIGIIELLNGITEFIKPNENITNTTSAFVFKLTHHDTLGVMAYVKVFSGTLNAKSVIYNTSQQLETKINQTKTLSGTKLIDSSITAGDIGIVTGVIGTKAGDVLGNPENIPIVPKLGVPVLSVQVKPEKEADYNHLAQALQIIDQEDPSLAFQWHKTEKELLLLLMGAMQTEILTHTLRNRFNIPVEITPPQIVYKETISTSAEGYIRYWMPKPCWAIMTFLIEPGAINSGVVYESKVSKNDIHNKYQNEISKTVPKALEQGLLGWEVTDVKITLISGEDHNMHTKPGDFNLATPMGIMKGLQNGGTHLLEPVVSFEIKTNESFLGKITSELMTRRATAITTEFENETVILKGTIPVATSLELSIKLNSICGGKMRLRTSFSGYQTCPEGEGTKREYKGVNPLDEAQWILHRRGAYKADERVI